MRNTILGAFEGVRYYFYMVIADLLFALGLHDVALKMTERLIVKIDKKLSSMQEELIYVLDDEEIIDLEELFKNI
jgi:hypothetical protein